MYFKKCSHIYVQLNDKKLPEVILPDYRFKALRINVNGRISLWGFSLH